MHIPLVLLTLLVLAVPPACSKEPSPTSLFAEALLQTQEKISKDPYANSAPDARRQTDDFIAGLVGAAWRLSHYARHLNKPAFGRGDEFIGLPGLFNPDNIYRNALLEDTGAYRIAGQRGSHSQLTFQLIDTFPMLGLSKDLMVIDLSKHGVKTGERFEFYLGGAKRDGLWWPMPKNASAILVRQTFADWQNETQSSLHITRLDADNAIPEGPDRLTLAAQYLRRVTTLWADNYMAGLRRLPFNVMPPMRASANEDGGLSGQRGVMARFKLNPDEALVITARPSDAAYQSIQLGNYWFVTPNPVMYLSSLNFNQTRTDADGLIRYVISLSDPGVANWLNPAGNSEGYIFMRWQGINSPLTKPDQPVAKKILLTDLPEHLPKSSFAFEAQDRAKQLRARRHFPSLKPSP